ncbi:MAG: lipopolysaccharide biosynthesis protein [Spirochaetaceae bacterium]|jgi:uncharacterized protein involved in exopolysaccharide biosynthesis|nr:lipopolysaccharide biosynthesis protein [Spirochaetaceae bacterium]
MSDEAQIKSKSGSTGDDDEISLIDLFAVLLRRIKMIIVITGIAMVSVVAYSIISIVMPPETSPLPNRYTPKALLLINTTGSGGGGLSSMLGNLGGLASLAGVSLPSGGGTNAELALYLVHSDRFLDTVVDTFDLINRWKIEKFVRAASRNILSKTLLAEIDEKSGVISVSFTDKDPVFATEVVNFAIKLLEERFDDMGLDKNKLEKENLEINIANALDEIKSLQIQAQTFSRSLTAASNTNAALESARIQIELEAQRQVYSQLKVQYELLKVTMASEKPVFQILETAQVPDSKSGPSRSIICLIVTFAAGFLSVFIAFALHAIENIKNDPEAMEKLRGKRPV